MSKKLRLVLLITIISGFLTGCQFFRKYQIESELQQLKPRQESLKQSLDSKKAGISTLQNRINKLTGDLSQNHNTTLTQMRNNPGKVACAASGTIAVTESNAFSKDLKELGTAIGLGCLAFYIFNEDFQKEVDEFVIEINKSSDRDKSFRSEIDSIKPKIESETKSLQTDKKAFDEITLKISDLEKELINLH
jgi:peptidoglycan hydrolase CwlO-like protein